MTTPIAIANTILLRSFQENISVTPMKLQKMIYFIYRDYLQNNTRPLFTERFETWQYGPVLPSVYSEFKSYRSNSIHSYAKDAKGTVYVVNEEAFPDISRSIEKIWETYKRCSGIELSTMTHKDGTAWSKAYDESKPYLEDDDIKSEQA